MSDAPNRPVPRTDAADAADGTAARAPGATDATLAPTDRVTMGGPDTPGFLGDFVVVQKLGEGGMGAVYLAEDTRLGRKVAIKLMKPQLGANELDRERFFREARAAAAVESDHLVPVLHTGAAADGAPFIVMPFLKGEMLDARLKREPAVPLDLVLKVAHDVAEGLAAMHAAGLVHRDIKPSNIWLEGDPSAPQIRRCKVLDFGLARSVSGDAQLTGSGAILGTPAYMAPEQARGEHVDHRADLFSLGATLYRMVTGKLPFDGPTPMAVVIAVATEAPRPARELVPHLPPELLDLVDRLMRKDREQRPRSAAEVAETARRLADQLKANPPGPTAVPPAARVPEPISTSQPQLLTAGDGPDIVPAPPRSAKRSRLPWAIAAVCLLTLVPLGLWLSGAIGGKPEQEVTKNEDAPKKAVNPEPNPDPDRRAAEHVLSLGGSVDVSTNNENRPVAAVRDLPTEPFRLRRVVIDGVPVKDADLAVFRDCRNVMYLGLPGTRVGDAGVTHFAGCKNLTYLYLHNTEVGGAGLAVLKDCTQLLDINLGNTPVTDADLVRLKPFTKLERLNLGGTKVSAGAVRDLAKTLPGCEIKWDGGTIGTSDRRAAEWVLSVGGCVCVDDKEPQIASAGRLPKGEFRLTAVTLTEKERVTDEGLAALARCKHLTSLGLSGTQVSDAGLEHLKESRNLMYLYLKGTKITSDGLAHFKDCTELLELDVSYTAVDDAGLGHIKRFTKLGHLFAKETAVTAGGVAALAKVLPNCNIEWDGTAARQADPDRRAALWVLSNPFANGSVRVDGDGPEIKSAKGLPKGPFRLTEVSLTPKLKGTELQVVPDAALAVFKDCKNVTGLYLAGTGITNAGLAHFSDCTDLKDLYLSGTKVDDDSAATIKRFTKLTGLALGATAVTEQGVLEIAKPLTSCRIQYGSTIEPAAEDDRKGAEHALSLGGTVRVNYEDRDLKDAKELPKEPFRLTYVSLASNKRVTDDALKMINGCRNLKKAQLSFTQVSDTGLAHLRECRELVSLDLDRTRIGDGGLDHLKGCAKLSFVSLLKTDATARGVEGLRKALPRCRILWDGGVLEPTEK